MMKTGSSHIPVWHMRLWSVAAIAFCGVAIGAVAAVADVNTTVPNARQVLTRRLEADEIQARALQARIAVSEQKAGLLRTADLFGESDDEKAARLAHERNQDASISQLNQRVSDVEDSLRRLTGQMEQLDHRLSDINGRIDRMQKDFDYKICTMVQQQLGAGSDQGGAPCAGASSQPAPSNFNPPPANAANAPQHLAPPPGILGTIPSNTAMPIPPPAGLNDSGAPPPVSNTRPQFDAAMNLLSKARYDEARAAFRNFADTNPQDALVPQAVYWVGDIAYVQKDYPNAARAFAEEIKKYGNSPRAPDSMLKLGQSLLALNQKQEGCTTLGALQSRYPQASKTVLGQAKAVRKSAGCH